ncbi:NAD-dependent succinate-semialdehyde dehydrogenase [Pantoea sp. 1.19]|uniref:NAD-dependent succinate-semialdehyde dehydrogenase n=1 Tax=Pantoea sp. 1.19 TaxID=1925589 RepID=UPI0009489678|nr:NAD-dependent succinate-semialdehyde dehydrogenase [Pantoea sp. 1.19]
MKYVSHNPATGKEIQHWETHTDAEAEQALARAHALYQSDWCKGDRAPRLALLRQIADVLDASVEPMARAATEEMGKLIEASRGEVKFCADIARYYADNAERFLAPVSYPTDLGEAWVEHHPIGVIMAVEPWNFPYYQLMRVLAPNLAVGNPVLCKHAQIVPRCATLFAEAVSKAGAPEGVWTNLFITSDQVADLLADKRIQGAALTGSERAGSAVAGQAASHLKKTTLELGGNDVFVVLDDADIADTARQAAQARLSNCGQVCTGAKRFLVQESVMDSFMQHFTAAMQQAKPGDPLDSSTTLGPLSSADALKGLTRQVDDAVANGARLVIGGKPLGGEGYFYPPTILTDIAEDNPARYEEFFGPVAQVYSVKDDEAIVALANDSNYGLGGAIFTRNTDRARRLASRIETGMVYINSATNTAAELPFGGVKRSGYGRELSDLGIKEFTNQKLIVISK